MNTKCTNILIILSLLFMLSTATTTLGEYTPLMQAIASKQPPATIAQLIAQGANVNECDMEFLRHLKPVLRYALDRGADAKSVEIIKMLIAAGADVNAITYNRVTDDRFYGMMPLLTYATIYSSPEIVQLLINAGAQDKVLNNDSLAFKKTALMVAQELGNTDMIQILQK